MKGLFHIYLETKGQGFGMAFQVCNLGSKLPYFNSAYVKGAYIFFHDCTFTLRAMLFVNEIKLIVNFFV